MLILFLCCSSKYGPIFTLEQVDVVMNDLREIQGFMFLYNIILYYMKNYYYYLLLFIMVIIIIIYNNNNNNDDKL